MSSILKVRRRYAPSIHTSLPRVFSVSSELLSQMPSQVRLNRVCDASSAAHHTAQSARSGYRSIHDDYPRPSALRSAGDPYVQWGSLTGPAPSYSEAALPALEQGFNDAIARPVGLAGRSVRPDAGDPPAFLHEPQGVRGPAPHRDQDTPIPDRPVGDTPQLTQDATDHAARSYTQALKDMANSVQEVGCAMLTALKDPLAVLVVFGFSAAFFFAILSFAWDLVHESVQEPLYATNTEPAAPPVINILVVCKEVNVDISKPEGMQFEAAE